ncbi:SusD family protein [compost metagenome]
MEALVDNATAFSREENYAATYATDDTEISRELYKNNVTAFTVSNLQRYVSSPEGIENLATDELWSGEYKKIFTANVILKNIDLVSGDEASRRRVKADAHFIRAMSYWILVNNYCAPYAAANMNSLGLPLKRTVDYEESLKRATLKETYDFILADIEEAKKVAETDVDPRKTWRVSQKAISAFMSRYYLFTGDYDKSLTESNKALESGTVNLVDYNSILPGRSASYSNPAATLKYSELNDWNAAKYLYWGELYYSRYQYTGAQWYSPSSTLVALYDQANDLRYKHLMIPNGGRRFSVVTPTAYRYTMFTDGSTLVSGSTRAEMLLNKAEVLARKGDVPNALLAVNTLRQKRMSTYSALTASNKDEAIKQVLAERRRELPFVMRWYDIRRFSVNDYAADDITVKRDFYQVSITGVDLNTPKTYTLESKHLVVPINGVEIDASKGQLQQNPY